jgi:hypothetical protein
MQVISFSNHLDCTCIPIQSLCFSILGFSNRASHTVIIGSENVRDIFLQANDATAHTTSSHQMLPKLRHFFLNGMQRCAATMLCKAAQPASRWELPAGLVPATWKLLGQAAQCSITRVPESYQRRQAAPTAYTGGPCL